MTDEEIVDLFFERSEQAIAELDKAHGGVVRRIALNILGDPGDAEECVSDTYLGVWNSIPPQRPAPLRTYVCRIARNLAAKRYHANTAQKRGSGYDLALDELDGIVPARGGVEEAVAARELAALINAFLDTLRYEDRYLFMRRYWYADPLREIARTAGMSYGAAAVRLHRVREKLRKYLLKEGVSV